jgi:hypothetical protein
MRKLLALPLVAAVACGGGFKDEARDAMPSKEAISMGSPPAQQASSTSGGDAITQNSTAGQQSPFWGLTVGVAVVFNVPTAAFLDLLRHVVEDYDPTSCDATSCTWQGSGPLDPVDYRLVVSRDGDGVSFDWSLSGAVKPGATYLTFATGVAKPGPQRHHGSGNFQIDFDKMATLGIAGNAAGLMQVTSYSNVGPAQLAVTFLGANDNDHPGQKNNVVYSFKNDNSGGGDLDFAMHNTTSGDRFAVHSRWKNDGRGRADITALPTGYTNISVSECWGAAPFSVVYFSSTEKASIAFWAGPDSGAEAQCAYSPADPSEMSAP